MERRLPPGAKAAQHASVNLAEASSDTTGPSLPHPAEQKTTLPVQQTSVSGFHFLVPPFSACGDVNERSRPSKKRCIMPNTQSTAQSLKHALEAFTTHLLLKLTARSSSAGAMPTASSVALCLRSVVSARVDKYTSTSGRLTAAVLATTVAAVATGSEALSPAAAAPPAGASPGPESAFDSSTSIASAALC